MAGATLRLDSGLGLLRFDECAFVPIKGRSRVMVGDNATSLHPAAVRLRERARQFLSPLPYEYRVSPMYVNCLTYQ